MYLTVIDDNKPRDGRFGRMPGREVDIKARRRDDDADGEILFANTRLMVDGMVGSMVGSVVCC